MFTEDGVWTCERRDVSKTSLSRRLERGARRLGRPFPWGVRGPEIVGGTSGPSSVCTGLEVW